MTEQRVTSTTLQGEVLEVDFDIDAVTVRLEDGNERVFPFELFDSYDVYQPGQHFLLTFDEAGEPSKVLAAEAPISSHVTISGYVESVDQDDELVWVYLRAEEGWHRKVMPLQLFRENGLDRPGCHFVLELDEAGTPVALQSDEDELEMMPQPIEETKTRWTDRPAAEAD